jgi:hypothetical protein
VRGPGSAPREKHHSREENRVLCDLTMGSSGILITEATKVKDKIIESRRALASACLTTPISSRIVYIHVIELTKPMSARTTTLFFTFSSSHS